MSAIVNRVATLFAVFITLHAPSGREVFVNADEVMLIQIAGPHWPSQCWTEITVHDQKICVIEAPGQVLRKVEVAKR